MLARENCRCGRYYIGRIQETRGKGRGAGKAVPAGIVAEPTVEETIEILKGLREKYEAHHQVKFTDEALEAATHLSKRYVSDRFLPDKAIDLIDEAGSRVG